MFNPLNLIAFDQINRLVERIGAFSVCCFQQGAVMVGVRDRITILNDDIPGIDPLIDIVDGDSKFFFAVNEHPIQDVTPPVKRELSGMAIDRSQGRQVNNFRFKNLIK